MNNPEVTMQQTGFDALDKANEAAIIAISLFDAVRAITWRRVPLLHGYANPTAASLKVGPAPPTAGETPVPQRPELPDGQTSSERVGRRA